MNDITYFSVILLLVSIVLFGTAFAAFNLFVYLSMAFMVYTWIISIDPYAGLTKKMW